MNDDARVFDVSLGRCGTKSTVKALEILGLSPVQHNPATLEEAVTLRGGAEGAVLSYWRVLLEVWPKAHFILTLRDEDSWLESSERTMRDFPLDRLTGNPRVYAIRNRLARWGTLEFHEKTMRRHMRQHFDDVRRYVPTKQLHFRFLGEGWETMSGVRHVLGAEEPKVEYPYLK